MEILYAIAALFISYIWIDYFRQIDVFQQERIEGMVLTLVFGGLSALLVINLESIGFGPFAPSIYPSDSHHGILLYQFLDVALIEELAKLLGFGLAYIFFRKSMTEPLDWVLYIAMSALGFAAVENYLYFSSGSSSIIVIRGVLSTVGHVMYSTMMIYGFILVRFRQSNPFTVIPAFAFLGMISHALFNSAMIVKFPELPILPNIVAALMVFFTSLEIFATILNNCINNSPHYKIGTFINPTEVSSRIITSYLVLIGIELVVMSFNKGIEFAIIATMDIIILAGFIILILGFRLGRFSIVPQTWQKLKFNLPFYVSVSHSNRNTLQIRGNGFSDALLTSYVGTEVAIASFTKHRSFFGIPAEGIMTGHFITEEGKPIYIIRLKPSSIQNESVELIATVKNSGNSVTKKKQPIVKLGLMKARYREQPLSLEEVKFSEWAVIASNRILDEGEEITY